MVITITGSITDFYRSSKRKIYGQQICLH